MGIETKPAAKPVRLGNVEILAANNGYVLFPYGSSHRREGWAMLDNQYVFADFAALTAWLKKNLRHGNGVEP